MTLSPEARLGAEARLNGKPLVGHDMRQVEKRGYQVIVKDPRNWIGPPC